MLLRSAASGDRDNVDALMAAIYADMRRIAEKHLRAERADHTLQPTALVHEAYLKLINQRGTDWKDRAHFFAIASRIIRRILVDHARQKKAAKRGAGQERVSMEDAELHLGNSDVDLMALDEALNDLAQLDAQQAKVVEMRFFGGLTLAEIAEALNMGRRSVDRSWSAARAWLYVRLSDQDHEPQES
ncbi:MAG: ECF-type sigma factor [Planctomycetota bacterium]